jgi:NitT/TauT family transport system permease protein
MSQDLLIAESKPAGTVRSRRYPVRHLIRMAILPIAAAAVFLIAWQAFVSLFGVRPTLLPAPSSIFQAIWTNRDLLIENAIPTTLESIGAFVLSVVLGGLLGVLLTYSSLAREALYPNVILFQLIPKVAVAPIFILWLGIGWESRVAIGLFIAFFPIVISTVAGLRFADPAILRLCASLAATRRQTFFKVQLPYALPILFNGMKISMTLAIIGIIVGEFITSQRGLGYILLFAGSRLETTIVMATLLVLCTVGLALYGLVALAEQVIMKRYGD